MFRHVVAKSYDQNIFKRQCEALEDSLPGLVNKRYLMDVDETEIQIYSFDGRLIKVYNDSELGMVYIESEFDLEAYFEHLS